VLVFCPRPCSTEVPTYTVDLDQDPKLRWQKLVTDKKADIVKLIGYVKWMMSFIDHGKLIPFGEDVFVSIIIYIACEQGYNFSRIGRVSCRYYGTF
jgi:hypothetical protein